MKSALVTSREALDRPWRYRRRRLQVALGAGERLDDVKRRAGRPLHSRGWCRRTRRV